MRGSELKSRGPSSTLPFRTHAIDAPSTDGAGCASVVDDGSVRRTGVPPAAATW